MPTYSFQMSARVAGSTVSVTAVGSTDVVASGTLDANAQFTASLPVGDYVATAAGGHYSYRSSGTVIQADPDQLADLPGTYVQPATVAAGYLDRASKLARDKRTNAPRFDTAVDGAAPLTLSGLALTGGYFTATVGGTNGDATYPLFSDRRSFRASFRVKATKATVGSRSTVGILCVMPYVAATGATLAYGFGYVQGTGLCFYRDNAGGAVTTILADASITDGTEYDVSVWFENGVTRGQTSGQAGLVARVQTTAGVDVGVATYPLTGSLADGAGTFLVRSNVASPGAISQVRYTDGITAASGAPTAGEITTRAAATSETAVIRIPKNPNGYLVIATHGRGGTPSETGWQSSNYAPTWTALEAAGFSVAVPRLGGDLWGNDDAQSRIRALYDDLRTYYGFEREVFLWGNSMGGGAALTAIAKGTVPVRAAYLAQPVCDLAAGAAGGLFPELAGTTVYPTTADRDDNDPMLQPVSAYAGVPMLFVASTGDTTAPKVTHTDAFRAKIGTTVQNYLIPGSGNHNDPSMFRAADVVRWFQAHLA